jgi:glyoxylase-like metal-dependent hydrolase (beta-lactamase superfamily II)
MRRLSVPTTVPTARTIVLAALMAVGALLIAVARAQPSPEMVRLEKVQDNLYLITGGRGMGAQSGGVSGNTTVFVATSGVVVVDTKYPGFGKTILDQVKSVTSKPVTMVINTHTHGDHTGSNNGMPRTAEVVAHENTLANMTRMAAFRGENAAFLPKKTFTERLSLLGGTERIDLYYFGRGHTNGDIVIVFPALRTAVMGDLFARKWAPGVDAGNGGSATAFPQTLAKAVATIRDVDTVITGHSTTTIGSGQEVSWVRSNPIMRWADLQEYAGFVRDFVAAAQAAQKAGKTVDQAVAELKLPDRYQAYNLANAKADVQLVYDESRR